MTGAVEARPIRCQIKVMPGDRTRLAFRYTADGKQRDEHAPENRYQRAQADLYDLKRGFLVLRVRERGLSGGQDFWVYEVEESYRDEDGVSDRFTVVLLTMFSVPRRRALEG